MTGFLERIDAADLRTAGVVVLCMSVSAGVALAVVSAWLWPAWLLVTAASALGVGLQRVATLQQGDGRRSSD